MGLSSSNSDVALAAFPGTLVASTNSIATSGTYFISVSALLDINATDSLGAFCYDTLASNGSPFEFGGSSSAGVAQGFQQAAITDVIGIGQGDSVQVWCYGSTGGVSDAFNAVVTATLINSASDAPAVRRHPRTPPGTLKPE